MLQGNLTKLDNDFITIWSNYMLYREIDRVALRKLAEMGQINAVQSYYLFFRERNPKVDEIVESYHGINPDEMFAKANKLNFYDLNNANKIKDIISKIIEIDKNLDDLQERYNGLSPRYGDDWDEIQEIQEEAEKLESKRGKLDTELFNIPYIKLKKECVTDYWNIGIQTKNPLFNERAVELQRSMPRFDISDLRKCIKFTRKGLVKLYKKDKEDILLQFALGKNLIMFRASDKEKELGSELLKKLSRRELSQEVQDYSENYCRELDEDTVVLPSIDDDYDEI